MAGDAEQRVGLDERAVGEPHPQPVRGMRAVHHVAEPEVRVDQRRVGLDVRAHHQDVARLQRRVVGEQAEQHLAQHVDLAGRAVAAVHLDGAVVVVQRPAVRPDGVGGDVGLQPAEQSVGMVAAAEDIRRWRVGGQAALQLAQVAAEGGQQRMADLRWLVSSRRGMGPCSGRELRHRSSLGCGSHRCRSWWVASALSSSISVVGSRVCPNNDSRCGRSIGDSSQPRKGFRVPDVRWVGVDPADQGAPQRRLPVEVVVEIAGVAVDPVDQQLRPLPGVGREQSGDAARDGVAPALPQLLLLARLEVAEMGGQRRCTRARRGCRRSPRAAATPWRPATTGRRRRCR